MDTIVALASGRPPAAIAIIRLSGPAAHAVAERIAGPLPRVRYAALRTLRNPLDGGELDRALVVRFDAPHSATGENVVEFQCHGSRAVIAAVIDAVTSHPEARLALPGEFTRRALMSGRIDLTEAEGLADLLEAETDSQRRTALAVATGHVSREVERWRSALIDLSARAEAAIDYVGDEDETGVDTRFLREKAALLATEIRQRLAMPRAEKLRDGVRVVIAGPPNAGKSSLLNALVGADAAIVTAAPGTTRDAIAVPLAIAGTPILLVDTAGLRDTADAVERLGIGRAELEIASADVVIWLGDRADAPAHALMLHVRSKADLVKLEGPGLAVSARDGTNLGELRRRLLVAAGAVLPDPSDVPLNQRQSEALTDVAVLIELVPDDLLLIAESLRAARASLDQLTGLTTTEAMLDALFERFCLGK